MKIEAKEKKQIEENIRRNRFDVYFQRFDSFQYIKINSIQSTKKMFYAHNL